MKILVTEATSSVAYQLLPLLASGDVITNQSVSLILCDVTERAAELQSVAEELTECGFTSLADATTSTNFCEASRTADVMLVLPPNDACAGNDRKEINVACTNLTQVDFQSLGYAMHPCQAPGRDMLSRKARGPMSTAAAIADCVKQIHQQHLTNSSIQVSEFERLALREEAEFGCPPLPGNEAVIHSCDNHLNPSTPELLYSTMAHVIFVSATRTADCDVIDEHFVENISEKSKVMYYARL